MPSPTQLAWLKSLAPYAQTTARVWKVPTSVTLAQAILESSWGASQLAHECRNLFGIKAKQGEDYREFETREVIRGRSVVELQEFARYGNVLDCFAAHAHLLSSLPRYAPAMAAAGSPTAFAIGLQRGGYSTEPTYAARLVDLISSCGLRQYELPQTPAEPKIPAPATPAAAKDAAPGETK